jgi:hypothetical protein
VTDLAGNTLAPFIQTFAPRTVTTILLGEIYDDSIGRPLSGAQASVLAQAGQPAPDPKPLATATLEGVFSLPVLPGGRSGQGVQDGQPGRLPAALHRRGERHGAPLRDDVRRPAHPDRAARYARRPSFSVIWTRSGISGSTMDRLR